MELGLDSTMTSCIEMSEGSSNIQQPHREKSKRPQLSCNSCRNRKVKCDRVQPCTACSMHQIADTCQYDLTESERHPILQAEALREKDKEIARLRIELLALGGCSTRSDVQYSDYDARKKRKSGFGARGGKKPTSIRQKKISRDDAVDSIFFGAPSLSTVIQELADLTLRSKAASLSHSPPQRAEAASHSEAISFPFPTLWPAKDGIAGLVALLPCKDEVSTYLDSFQRRVQGCSFPHVPEECTRSEVERFFSNLEHNTMLMPDMLALIFAALAQGLQHGLYDRCGEQWVPGTRGVESKKGDVFVAASMQSLRLASFMSRPTLLAIETLVMIGPYLTDSGKLLDAWALFGVTVRLAQAIGLHRDPSHLCPCPPPEEVTTRKNLWWWMLHLDQQYSVTLGRPLGISSIGDCPTPVLLHTNPLANSLSNYLSQFSILARQILSAGYLCNAQIDEFTDQLLSLQADLPEPLQFTDRWLQRDHLVPVWPLNAQVASLHQKTHNFIILLNRQRVEDNSMDTIHSNSAAQGSRTPGRSTSRGCERVLQSCREILLAFEFFHTRVQAGMVCWTICQQAFNAAHILVIAMIEFNAMENYPLVCQTYDTFCDIQQLGIHQLAGTAIERIETLINNSKNGCDPVEKVMSKQGMALLEYVSQPNPDESRFAPVRINAIGNDAIATGMRSDLGAERPEVLPTKPTKKKKPNSPNTNVQRNKAMFKKGNRKDTAPPRRASSGLWARDNMQLDLMNSFSSPTTPTHAYHSSKLSSVDIQSTLELTSHNRPDLAPRATIQSGLHTAPPTSTTFNANETKPWMYASHSSPTSLKFSTAPSASVSAPSSYHPTPYLRTRQNPHLSTSNSLTGSRPPSLHMSSHPSSSYANSFASSLHTTSGLQTPSASHPVSPSLSQNHNYCLSQPQTQPQSPVWGAGFGNAMDCAELAIGLQGQEGCTEVDSGRAWLNQDWSG